MNVEVLSIMSIDVDPFDITIRFFPDTLNDLTFDSTFDTTLLDRLRHDNPIVADRVDGWHDNPGGSTCSARRLAQCSSPGCSARTTRSGT